MKLQKLGGYAAIASVFFILVVVPILAMKISGGRLFGDDPVKWMAAISAAPANFLAIALLSIVGSILAFVMYLALHERMQANAVHLARIMLITASASSVIQIMYSVISIVGNGVITPTQDISAYRAFLAITNGLQIMVGLLTAWTCLFIGCAILKTRSLSRVLGWLYLLTGILWMLHFMFRHGMQFVLLAVAIIWTGIALLRQKQPQPAAKEIALS
jgi:hypothetical protein